MYEYEREGPNELCYWWLIKLAKRCGAYKNTKKALLLAISDQGWQWV